MYMRGSLCCTWSLKSTMLGILHSKGVKLLYSSALAVMWIATIANFTNDWAMGREGFVARNSSPLAIIVNMSVSIPVLWNISGIITAGISDAIIVNIFCLIFVSVLIYN